jgi:hypothetical protein
MCVKAEHSKVVAITRKHKRKKEDAVISEEPPLKP